MCLSWLWYKLILALDMQKKVTGDPVELFTLHRLRLSDQGTLPSDIQEIQTVDVASASADWLHLKVLRLLPGILKWIGLTNILPILLRLLLPLFTSVIYVNQHSDFEEKDFIFIFLFLFFFCIVRSKEMAYRGLVGSKLIAFWDEQCFHILNCFCADITIWYFQ